MEKFGLVGKLDISELVENLDIPEELGLVKRLGLVDVVEKLEKLDLDEKMDFEGKVVVSFCSGSRLASVIGAFVLYVL